MLLTGGCGFIGVNLALSLLRRPRSEIEILVVLDAMVEGSDWDNLDAIEAEDIRWCSSEGACDTSTADSSAPCHTCHGSRRRFRFVCGRYGDRVCVDHLLKRYRIDTVMHLAGETNVDRSYLNPRACIETNIVETHSFFEALRDYEFQMQGLGGGVPRGPRTWVHLKLVLYMSTDEIYGDSREEYVTEKAEARPTNVYAMTKYAAEMDALTFMSSYGMPSVRARCNNVYGPRQTEDKVIPRFLSLIRDGKPITIRGDGKQLRCWMNVEDVCAALWTILTRGKVGKAYNIGGGKETSILELAQHLFDASMAVDREGQLSSDLPGARGGGGTSGIPVGFEPRRGRGRGWRGG